VTRPRARRNGQRSEARAARRRRRIELSFISATLFFTLAQPGVTAPTPAQEEIRAGAITFRYWPGQQRAASALVDALDTPPIMPALPGDILAAGRIVVYLTPDAAAFDSLAPGVPDWSGGIAFPQGDEIVLPVFADRLGSRPMLTVLRHELAHVALGRYLGSSVPRWFHEGYAQLASGSWGAQDAWTLRGAILLGRLPSLDALNLDFRGTRVSADHAYLLSYTAVDYMRRLGGPTGFARLLQRWNEIGDLDAAMRRTYGITLGQFEQMWRKDVAGRFGWLLVLAQTTVYWTALTIILLVMGYWKKRRNSKKLAALEAAERETWLWEEGPGDSGEIDDKSGQIDGG